MFGNSSLVWGCESPEDFGAQGKQPSHPIARLVSHRLSKSGWDTKRLIRQIVTSDMPTIRFGNKRGSRIRSAKYLAVSSSSVSTAGTRHPGSSLIPIRLLVEKRGGPSVKPYQPPGLWAMLQLRLNTHRTGESRIDAASIRFGDGRWALNMFDEADRKLCSVRMRRTNTPLYSNTFKYTLPI